MKPTGEAKGAIEWLRRRGGDGAIVRARSQNPDTLGATYTTVLAAGEFAPFWWRTFKTLISIGQLEEYRLGNSRRVRIPAAGPPAGPPSGPKGGAA